MISDIWIRHGVNSILSIPIPIPIPPNSIWSIPIPIPHQIYQFQFQFQFKIDQFQFNSVYIFLYNLCKIFLIHLLFYYLAIYWYVYIIIHIAIYSIYMNTNIQTNNMFMMLWCVFIISRGAGGPGREILQRPPSVCLSVRPSVRPSRLVFAL